MPLFDDLKAHEKEELLVSYAVLILHDDKAPISEENINKLVTAAKGTATEPFTKAFCKWNSFI